MEKYSIITIIYILFMLDLRFNSCFNSYFTVKNYYKKISEILNMNVYIHLYILIKTLNNLYQCLSIINNHFIHLNHQITYEY
jgi:hypothetical protein